jgi:hypothetical protein
MLTHFWDGVPDRNHRVPLRSQLCADSPAAAVLFLRYESGLLDRGYCPGYPQYRNHHAGYPAQLVCQWHAGPGRDGQYLHSSVQRPWYLQGGGRAHLSAKFSLRPPSQAARDSVYVVVDSLPGTNIQVDGSEYLPGSYANIRAVVVACVFNTRQLS